MTRARFLTANLIALTFVGSPVHAQRGWGVVSGIITNEAGMPLSDVEVMVDPSRRDAQMIRTNDRGRYVFDAVGPGMHTIR